MRPAYETENDRAAEARIAASIAHYWSLKAYKLKPYYPIDFALINPGGLLHSWLETKRRKVLSTAYREIILSQHKICAGLQLARDTHTSFYFAVEFFDGLYYVEIMHHRGYPVRIAGRSDRSDAADMEPCAYIPITDFQRIT